MRNFIAVLLTILPLLGVAQPDPVVAKIIELGKSDNQTMHHHDVLCNRIGGRPIGSSNYESAVVWASSKFKEWGMEVILHQTGVLPVGFNRGQWSGRLLAENGMVLHFATPSYSVGTKGVQRGHVLIEPKNRAEFDRMKSALRGAWVLISGKNSGWPIDYTAHGDSIRAAAIAKNLEIDKENAQIRLQNQQNEGKGSPRKELLPYVEEPAIFYKEMVEAGILGIVQSAPTPILALYDRKNLFDMTWDNLPKIPDIKLDEHQFAVIEQMAKERRYFQLEFDIRNNFRPGPIPYHTVIGLIRGTEFPDEYVIIGGHLDSFDVSTGASDNAAGVTPSIEAARLIMQAGAKPKRSILVCLWSGEEFGMYGSTAWVLDANNNMDKVSVMFNRDGGPGAPVGLAVSDAMFGDFEKICEPLSSIDERFPFTLSKREPRPKPKQPGGTDTSPFLIAGVPALGFSTKDVLGYNFSYGEIWHTERDTYEKCPAPYMNHASVVTAIVAYGVANLDHMLPRQGFFAPDEQPTKTKEVKKKK